MIKPGIFGHLSPFKKLILMLLLALLSMAVFMAMGWLFALLYYNDFLSFSGQLNNFDNPVVVEVLKFFQIINQIGLFIFPPLMFAYLDEGSISRYLKIDRLPGLLVMVLSCMLVFSALPLIHWSADINELLSLPEWLAGFEKWMKETEENAREITEVFLDVTTTGGLFINLIMIALLPAIGEELFFRGVIQKLFHQWLKNAHWAVIITAVIFSALHLQFYGFLPRTILGIMFGYLFVITKSLWVPILAHFVNNGAAVIVAFLFRKEILQSDYQEIGYSGNPLWVIISILTIVVLFVVIIRNTGLQERDP
jgi:uncharacterized protein